MTGDAPAPLGPPKLSKTVSMTVGASLSIVGFQAKTGERVIDPTGIDPRIGFRKADVAGVATHAGADHAGVAPGALSAIPRNVLMTTLAFPVGHAQQSIVAGATGQVLGAMTPAQRPRRQEALARRRHRRQYGSEDGHNGGDRHESRAPAGQRLHGNALPK